MLINSIANSAINQYKINFGANFNKLEQQAIDAVRVYSQKHGVETAQIIKNGINITDKFVLTQTPNAVMVSMPSETDKIFNLKGLSKVKAIIESIKAMVNFKSSLKDSVYIHSHTTEMPLTPADIYTGIRFGIAKMIAVTPSGSTSVMEGLNKNTAQAKNCLSVFDNQIKKGHELSEQFGQDYMKVPEAFKIIQEGEIDAIHKFAESTGVKYSSDIK